jgi:hypothetical protein
MRIDFECSGGFANLQLRYHADTEQLPAQVSDELARLVGEAGVFDLQPQEVAPRAAGPPDVTAYRLSVADGGKRTSLSVTDVTAPPRLHPLLAYLRKLAIEQRLDASP